MSEDQNRTNPETPGKLASASGRSALIVSAIDEIESTAAALAAHLNLSVEIAATKSTALRLLGRKRYAIVILDQVFADTDPEGSELIWKNAAVAIPLQINFALAGSTRLEREVRSALARREREQQLAVSAAAGALDVELKNAITGFLLESQLALAEADIPPPVESRLRTLAGMAEQLRERLLPTVARGTTSVSLMAPPK